MNSRIIITLMLCFVLAVLPGCAPENAPGTNENKNPGTNQQVQPAPGQPSNNQTAQNMKVTLYFATKDVQYLVPVAKEVPKNNHPAKTAIEMLIGGPENPELRAVVPPTSRVRGIAIREGIAFVDFNEEFRRDNPGGSTGEMMAIGAVVNTLTTIEGVKAVHFSIEGKSIDTLKGHLDLSDPVERMDDLIKK